ncbi:hypothetical protein SKAU_G00249470 [Synaphobranchus kaupii]|uniref:Uncharacterized protein n=1 Tax=Synaphobranchus kaupii TaxID=118154 RepID=A0A9Q1F2Z2_SYNKA|nr:hypothetical protein SKAU_G00249470 [Synaphobranchus kaupii]
MFNTKKRLHAHLNSFKDYGGTTPIQDSFCLQGCMSSCQNGKSIITTLQTGKCALDQWMRAVVLSLRLHSCVLALGPAQDVLYATEVTAHRYQAPEAGCERR